MNVSMVVARAVLARVERSGADADPWLRSLGLERSAFTDVQQMLSPPQWDAFLVSAMRHLHDPALGLTIGFEDGLSALHVFGWMLQSARTLRESLDLWVRYSPLLDDGIKADLVQHGEYTHLVVEFGRPPHGEATRFSEDLVFATLLRSCAHLHRTARPTVRLQQAEPLHRARMSALFQCEIAFASRRSEAIFDRRVLDIPLPFGDAEAVECLSGMASAVLQRRLQGMQSVSERVRSALSSGYDQAALDLDTIATLMRVNPRNLRRWLRREGTSWRAIVDDFRRERAMQYLRRGGTTIKEVSDTMGYSEPSAFHRAFRRWTGVAPAAYLRTESP